MRKLWLALSLLCLGQAPAQAQTFTMPPPAGVAVIGCVYNSTPPTLVSGTPGFVQCDTNGAFRLGTAPAGTIIGTVAIDQTTPGTTNAVQQVPGTAGTMSGSITNPTSTLTMTSATTAYTANQIIATSATAGSIVNPSFAILNSAGGAAISRLRLSVNDATSTAWGAQTIQVDLWSTTPTWTNGDRAAWALATGAAGHLGSFSCTMSAVNGDGVYAECSPSVGNFAGVKLASGTSIFWSLKATTGSGVTGASKVFTLTAELIN